MKRSPLRKVSNKRAVENALYLKLRKQFLEENPDCKLCGMPAHDIHHRRGRFKKRLVEVEFFLSVCRACHTIIHENPKWAERRGYLLKDR